VVGRLVGWCGCVREWMSGCACVCASMRVRVQTWSCCRNLDLFLFLLVLPRRRVEGIWAHMCFNSRRVHRVDDGILQNAADELVVKRHVVVTEYRASAIFELLLGELEADVSLEHAPVFVPLFRAQRILNSLAQCSQVHPPHRSIPHHLRRVVGHSVSSSRSHEYWKDISRGNREMSDLKILLTRALRFPQGKDPCGIPQGHCQFSLWDFFPQGTFVISRTLVVFCNLSLWEKQFVQADKT